MGNAHRCVCRVARCRDATGVRARATPHALLRGERHPRTPTCGSDSPIGPVHPSRSFRIGSGPLAAAQELLGLTLEDIQHAFVRFDEVSVCVRVGDVAGAPAAPYVQLHVDSARVLACVYRACS